jgi:hypothetical protein
VAFEELIIPDELHDLLRWSDWVRAYRATAEFFDPRAGYLTFVADCAPAVIATGKKMSIFA